MYTRFGTGDMTGRGEKMPEILSSESESLNDRLALTLPSADGSFFMVVPPGVSKLSFRDIAYT